MASLTEAGRVLVDSLDEPMNEMIAGIFAGLGDSQVATLNELLESARSAGKEE